MPITKITLHWDTGEIKELNEVDSWIIAALVNPRNAGGRLDVIRASNGGVYSLPYLLKCLEFLVASRLSEDLGEHRDGLDPNPAPIDAEEIEA